MSNLKQTVKQKKEEFRILLYTPLSQLSPDQKKRYKDLEKELYVVDLSPRFNQ